MSNVQALNQAEETLGCETIAINAVNCRMIAVGRTAWGPNETRAKHIIMKALQQVTADLAMRTEASMADPVAAVQEANKVLDKAGSAFAEAAE